MQFQHADDAWPTIVMDMTVEQLLSFQRCNDAFDVEHSANLGNGTRYLLSPSGRPGEIEPPRSAGFLRRPYALRGPAGLREL
jgi:hypothetical protein